MLIVVSDAAFHKNEPALLNEMFDQGLEFFHLRKPSAPASALQHLIEKIKPQHISKIALHSHHQLANIFRMNRLHYTEVKRKKSNPMEWQALKESGCHLSTSVHQIQEAAKLPGSFDYAFLGPVFDSISKQGYSSTISKKIKMPKNKTKLIAIGGINEINLKLSFEMGFDGIAILGAIWQSTDPVKSFQLIKKACSSIVP
ncbi:MAG: thiamine phosphate synthase [Bacteroidetes bacterium]|nr:thiamine phosphate synthase [Bacteroidota bacterium]